MVADFSLTSPWWTLLGMLVVLLYMHGKKF